MVRLQKVVDGFTDMSKKEIKEYYQKNENAFNVAVNRMIRDTSHENWKYKKDGEIWITADGVEWLDGYFKKPFDVSADPIVTQKDNQIEKLEIKVEMLERMLEQAKDSTQKLVEAKLEAKEHQMQQIYLLEQKEAEKALNEAEKTAEEAKREAEKYKKMYLHEKKAKEELQQRGFWDRLFNKGGK